MENARFIGMLTLLGAALGCSVAMLIGILLYRSTLGKVILIGIAIGAACGLIVGIICFFLKKSATKKR